jgi:hypothetical protein
MSCQLTVSPAAPSSASARAVAAPILTRSGRKAAIDGQTGAGDEAGFGTSEVGDRAGDLITLAVARQRYPAFY